MLGSLLYFLVVFVHERQQVRLRQILGLTVLDRVEAQGVGGLLLRRDIAHRCRVFAHEDRDESRNDIVLRLKIIHLLFELFPDLLCDFCPTDQLCRHGLGSSLFKKN